MSSRHVRRGGEGAVEAGEDRRREQNSNPLCRLLPLSWLIDEVGKANTTVLK